jgi:YrbI family 3-deoxy-D-manno-octulosonate 8-phosphate phosphatase
MIDNRNYPDSDLVDIIKSIRLIIFDFDGVFTDNAVYVDQNGVESVRCNRSDGIGLSKLRRLKIHQYIISTESNHVVQARAKKLNIPCKNNCDDKKKELDSLIKSLGISLSQVAFVGNDINDRECMQCVGFPVVVKDAHPDVLKYGKYVTKTNGGYGAVREVCDMFEKAYAPANSISDGKHE